jgi:hypothetical protein
MEIFLLITSGLIHDLSFIALRSPFHFKFFPCSSIVHIISNSIILLFLYLICLGSLVCGVQFRSLDKFFVYS